jgi:large subunit ribosomal protein L25
MAVIPLNGTRREDLGKGGARKARAAGQIPGVLYGHGETPVAVAVGSREFDQALHRHKGGNPIVNLSVAGSEYTALIRDVQYDPINHAILHLDFQHISLTETIEVDVLVHLVGLPIGVKDGGGILETITRMVKVRCLPTAIPSSLDVNVEALNIGDSVHVRDLAAPNVTVLTDPETTVAAVVAPTVMEEKPAEAVAVEGAAAAAEPEVIAKGKKDEEGDEKSDKPEKGEKAEKGKEKK